MAKTLRAADIGYVWPEWLPDGATWTRDGDWRCDLWHSPAVHLGDDRWAPEVENTTIVDEDRDWLGLTPPYFGNLHWTKCILVKGDEPPKEVTE